VKDVKEGRKEGQHGRKDIKGKTEGRKKGTQP
jgi:hypothetical protein